MTTSSMPPAAIFKYHIDVANQGVPDAFFATPDDKALPAHAMPVATGALNGLLTPVLTIKSRRSRA